MRALKSPARGRSFKCPDSPAQTALSSGPGCSMGDSTDRASRASLVGLGNCERSWLSIVSPSRPASPNDGPRNISQRQLRASNASMRDRCLQNVGRRLSKPAPVIAEPRRPTSEHVSKFGKAIARVVRGSIDTPQGRLRHHIEARGGSLDV